MSAIFGIIHHDSSPVTRDHLLLMAGPVQKRGPDGIGLHVEDSLGLGFARLQTGSLLEPVAMDGSGALVISADARLDNREELLKILELPAQISSTEIVQHAHRRWGSEAPRHFLGAFSYAIWDRSQQILTIVRDQIGVRPMYLVRHPSFTAFATDHRSLLALPRVSDDIDEIGIFHFFYGTLLMVDKETTCFSMIKRLPPAQVAQVSVDGVFQKNEYWTLDPERELDLGKDDNYAEAFREHFTTAVARCIPPSGNVGSTLSGGLDSSSIALTAAKLLKERGVGPLHTYSAVFPSSPIADETEFIDAVAASENIFATRFAPGELSPLQAVIPTIQNLPQPFFAPNIFLSIEACKACNHDGFRVLLDGSDGDTTVGHGFDRFLEDARARDWDSFGRELGAFLARFKSVRPNYNMALVHEYGGPELQKMTRELKWIAVIRAINLLGNQLGISRKALLKKTWRERQGRTPAMPGFSQLSPHFVNRVQAEDRMTQFLTHHSSYPYHRRPIQLRALQSGFLPLVFETLDITGASFGLEYRFPFCDRELIEFCLAVPSRQQMHDGWSRWIMRNGMQGVLPDQVCWRGGKGDLSPVHRRGMRKFDLGTLEIIATRIPGEIEPYINKNVLFSAHERFINDKASAMDYQLLWNSVILLSWLRNKN